MFHNILSVGNFKRKIFLSSMSLVAVFGLSACKIEIKDDSDNANPDNQKSVVVDQYTVRAYVENLEGSGMVLQINGAGNVSPDVNGNVTFPIKIDDGASYNVTVITQPTSPAQNCVVTTGTGSGMISGADVANVRIACTTVAAAVALNFNGSTPADGAANIAVDSMIKLSFSAALDHITVSSASIKVTGLGGNVEGQLDIDGQDINFTPDQPLSSLTEYVVTVTTDVEDIAGNALSEPHTFNFNTGINTNKWYRLTNKQLGANKSLDTSNPDYKCQITDSGNYTGQYWRFTPVKGNENAYVMQTMFAGERQSLEGADGESNCLFTGFANTGAPFGGQIWKLTPTGDGYFRLQNSFKGNAYSLDADPQPKLDLTSEGDDQKWKLTEINDVPVLSLNQFVFVEGTASYQYGALNAVPNMEIADAPADSDFGRWAMLANGQDYRLFVLKRYTNDTLYQFAYNTVTQKYEWGFGGLDKTVNITGMPDDADTSSIAMVYAEGASRLYMRSKSNNAIYQFKFDAASKAFAYGVGTAIPQIDITGSPVDTDWRRWAMLHDGTNYRIYAMKANTSDQIYQFSYNAVTGDYEYGFESIEVLSIDQIPVESDRQSFAILHDGSKSRLYMLAR